MIAALGKRIHCCSSCIKNLLSQVLQVPFASAKMKTRFVLGSFSAWYILERRRHMRDTRSC